MKPKNGVIFSIFMQFFFYAYVYADVAHYDDRETVYEQLAGGLQLTRKHALQSEGTDLGRFLESERLRDIVFRSNISEDDVDLFNGAVEEAAEIFKNCSGKLSADDQLFVASALRKCNELVASYEEDDAFVTRGCCKKIKKALNVGGNALFCKNVDIGGDLSVGGTFGACELSNICPLLIVTGPTGPTGTVNVTGPISLSGPVTIGNCANMTGDLIVGGTLNICSNEVISGMLNVSGAANFASTITVNGEVTFENGVTMSGTLLAGTGVFSGDLSVDGELAVEGTINACQHNICCAVTNSVVYAGTGTTSATGPVLITFPSNYFAAAPVVVLSPLVDYNTGAVISTTPSDFQVIGSESYTNCNTIAWDFSYIAMGEPGSGYCVA
jgi:hypothetical protein